MAPCGGTSPFLPFALRILEGFFCARVPCACCPISCAWSRLISWPSSNSSSIWSRAKCAASPRSWRGSWKGSVSLCCQCFQHRERKKQEEEEEEKEKPHSFGHNPQLRENPGDNASMERALQLLLQSQRTLVRHAPPPPLLACCSSLCFELFCPAACSTPCPRNLWPQKQQHQAQ